MEDDDDHDVVCKSSLCIYIIFNSVPSIIVKVISVLCMYSIKHYSLEEGA